MNKTEYGGYFGLDLKDDGNSYYEKYKPMSFSCARYAILQALRFMGKQKVYLPVYLCDSVKEVLIKNGIKVYLYHINNTMEPCREGIEVDAAILITNYFGITHNNPYYVKKYKNVIFDNTQAFFEKPIKGAFNVYSCRKFFGVTDGAYLISDLINGVHSESMDRFLPLNASYLVGSIIYGTNRFYGDSLKNEMQLAEEGIKRISHISESLLSCIDYSVCIKKRRNNFKILTETYGNINEFFFINDEDFELVPMIYPLLIKKDECRKKMITNNIYVPQWWKCVLDSGEGNDYENSLSEYLLPIPIDQRYEEQDIKTMISIINKCI